MVSHGNTCGQTEASGGKLDSTDGIDVEPSEIYRLFVFQFDYRCKNRRIEISQILSAFLADKIDET